MFKRIAVAAVALFGIQTASAEEGIIRQQFSCPASGCKIQCTATPTKPAFNFTASNTLLVTINTAGTAIYTADNGATGKYTLIVNQQEQNCGITWD